MDPERHARIGKLFSGACELDGAARDDYLSEACQGDDVLRAEVEQLLERDAATDPRLSPSSGRGDLIRDVLGGPAAAEREQAPTRVGPYRLLERIGEGGMGEVFAAEQLEPVRRRVALKLIKRGMDSAQVVARFEAERQALARMSHPNIAQVYDGGTCDDGRPYFVMEHVAGEPITAYCDRRSLATRDRVELFLDVCEGVQHAHQKGVVHRDLKPNNVLVMPQDGRAAPKIIDFGIARATTGRLVERTLHTELGQVVGTLDYMSPEQADPTGVDIDTRSDIYSLGVVLYQLVSGLLPFEFGSASGLRLAEVQLTIRDQEPPAPSTRLGRQTGTATGIATAIATRHGTDERTLVGRLRGDLDWICLKALEKDPARRYPSVSELADDLRRYLAHEPVLAGRPGALYRARKFVRRNRLAVAATLLIVVVGFAGLQAALSGRQVARALRPQADAHRLRRLELEADRLWPAHPQQIPGLLEWQEKALALLASLPAHRESLDRMRARAVPSSDDSQPFRFESDEDQSSHDVLSELVEGREPVEGLEDLRDDRTGLLGAQAIAAEHGWSVPRRLAFARRLELDFAPAGEHAQRWDEALPAIHAAYPGLELTPQMGLVPIGPDPASDLWEFAHLMTGEAATRAPDGRLVLTAQTGVVLVLLPGGSFWMGAQPDDATARQHDPMARGGKGGEGPVHKVRLSPFLISKYELTQAQWQRLTGHNPSMVQADGDTARHPVEQVSWWDASTCMGRAGLALPSEAQWEYAARAGTQTPWSTGEAPGALIGAANLLHDDDLKGPAEVGILAPNGFGLHDVHGNVWEWCRDAFADGDFYSRSPELDPVCVLDEDVGGASFSRSYRGGAFKNLPFIARSSHRTFRVPTWAGGNIGLRPAMRWAE